MVTQAWASAGQARLPVQQIRVFALTNAPATTTTGNWSTNHAFSSSQLRVIQQVASLARTNLSLQSATNSLAYPGGFRDEKQREAMLALQQRVGGSLQVYLRSENSTPMQIKGQPLANAVATSGNDQVRNEATARSFLQANATLLLLDDPNRELQLSHRQVDDLGGEILRFTQQYQGVPVWPAELAVHLDARGDVVMLDGAYAATPQNLAVQPSLTSASVAATARSATTSAMCG